jgi:aryl-alcohol dehydrogenase-like predicted oxidoreductase
VVVVSKGGYLQGQNYAMSQQRKQDGNPFADVVEYADGLEHCIHPDFLDDQIGRSLDRLGLDDPRRLPAAQPRVLPGVGPQARDRP